MRMSTLILDRNLVRTTQILRARHLLKQTIPKLPERRCNTTIFEKLPLHTTELEAEPLPIDLDQSRREIDRDLGPIRSRLIESIVSHGDTQETEIWHIPLEDKGEGLGDNALDPTAWKTLDEYCVDDEKIW